MMMRAQVKVIEARKREGVSKLGKAYSFVGVMFQDAEGHVFEGNLDPDRAAAFLKVFQSTAGKAAQFVAVLEPWGKYREPRLADLVPVSA